MSPLASDFGVGGTSHKIIAFFCFCCTLFQGLVFLVKQSEACAVWCGLGSGGRCGVTACVFWFIACLLNCFAGKAPDVDVDEEEEKEPAPAPPKSSIDVYA